MRRQRQCGLQALIGSAFAILVAIPSSAWAQADSPATAAAQVAAEHAATSAEQARDFARQSQAASRSAQEDSGRARLAATRARDAANQAESEIRRLGELKCDPGTAAWDRFNSGGTESRRCVVERLISARYQPDEPTFQGVRRDVGLLADFYASRSDRQQAFIDTGAFFTGTGVLGFGASDGAGVTTQSYWGYGALLPIILVQFNANEPTRDLFFAGKIGVDLINERYLLLGRRLALIEGLKARDQSYRTSCDGVEAKLVEVERWAANDDKAAILPAVAAVARRCRDLAAGRAGIENLTTIAAVWKSQWARDLAADVVRLDDRLVERDNRLRTSPAEALTMLVSTSLRTLDALVSGENAQAAIDSIKVQAALEGLGMRLSESRLPPAPGLIVEPLVVSAAAEARAGISRTTPPRGAPAAPDILATVAWLRSRVGNLEEARAVYNERALWAAELSGAAKATQLEFAFNANTKQVDVVLRAPGGQLPAGQTAPAGQASAAN
jgi:hypothetical protein